MYEGHLWAALRTPETADLNETCHCEQPHPCLPSQLHSAEIHSQDNPSESLQNPGPKLDLHSSLRQEEPGTLRLPLPLHLPLGQRQFTQTMKQLKNLVGIHEGSLLP